MRSTSRRSRIVLNRREGHLGVDQPLSFGEGSVVVCYQKGSAPGQRHCDTASREEYAEMPLHERAMETELLAGASVVATLLLSVGLPVTGGIL